VARSTRLHEAWIGEHHSAGYEIIASPELFIAAAAERTRHIKLVPAFRRCVSPPADARDRINQLDHQTRGERCSRRSRALPSDAFMRYRRGSSAQDDEAIGVLVPLLRGETSHTRAMVRAARCASAARAFTRPHIEICVASQVSRGRARAASTASVCSRSAATSTGCFNALAMNWKICADKAAEHGHAAHAARGDWSPMHIAETREKARETCASGSRLAALLQEVAALPLAPAG